MALQRTAGNAAVGRVLARRTASPKPPLRPNPSWSQKGYGNPGSDCTPLDAETAGTKWSLYAWLVPDKVTERCGCDLAGDAYAEYLEAKGTRHTLQDDGNCISRQLAEDDGAHNGDAKHPGPEEQLMEQWREQRRDVIWATLTGTTREAEIDLTRALGGVSEPADPNDLWETDISSRLTYTRNDKAGGLLFGSGTSNYRDPDSEYGFDTRHVRGTIRLRRLDDGAAPDWMNVEETITFRYRIHDALDFCPGNTWKKDKWDFDAFEYNTLLSDLSRLEASGMARDVEYTVHYHRTRTESGMAERPHQTPPLPVPPEPDPKPTPPPRPKPAPSGGRLKAARFQGPDGQPDPTLQACADDQARLREGDSGGPVAMVQRALLDTGGPSLGTSGPDGDGVDAVYGPKTAAAVRAFKAREELGFEQFGDVGPGTMHRLDELLA